MERLIEALRLMACSADAQIAALPDFVVVADEVALLFDDEFRAVDLDACTSVVRDGLVTINRELSEMSKSKSPSLWTIEALRAASDWESLRTTAKAVLTALGVSIGRPDLSWATYVPGTKP
jgi:hypothetical protein